MEFNVQGGHQVGLQGGNQGVLHGVLKFLDGPMKSQYESGIVTGGFS